MWSHNADYTDWDNNTNPKWSGRKKKDYVSLPEIKD
jgi:hypothetical protein